MPWVDKCRSVGKSKNWKLDDETRLNGRRREPSPTDSLPFQRDEIFFCRDERFFVAGEGNHHTPPYEDT